MRRSVPRMVRHAGSSSTTRTTAPLTSAGTAPRCFGVANDISLLDLQSSPEREKEQWEVVCSGESREIAALPLAKAMGTRDQSAGMPMSGRNRSGNILGASLRLVSPRPELQPGKLPSADPAVRDRARGGIVLAMCGRPPLFVEPARGSPHLE